MLKHRIIPCLLVHNGGLVKTQRFTNPKYVGDPINAIRIFNDKEVDELVVLDISVSKEKREPNYELIEQLASECFMPLCYGGGIRTIEQARTLFGLGLEKIAVQSAALEDLTLLTKIAEQFGSQSVVISVDVKKNWLGKRSLFMSASGKMTSRSWEDFIQQAVAAGAGEVMLNAVDRDGLMQGMDLELIKDASANVPIPLIAIGGVGCLADIKAAVEAGASAVAAGAFFVYQGPHRAVLITYPNYQELEHLLKGSK
jgi:cyclase